MAKFIAEIGSNHNGNLQRALSLVDAAAEAGFWAVKFQAWKLERLFAEEAFRKRPELHERKRLELPTAWHPVLKTRCQERGVKYGCTACDRVSLREMLPYVDFIKIGSYEMLNFKLLSDAGASGLPVVISTGMSTMEECLSARQALMAAGCCNITFLHCVSQYPALNGVNLRAIDNMQKQICWPIGYSDHTTAGAVPLRAVHRWRATAIELHMDLDDLDGSESLHSYPAWRAKHVIDDAAVFPEHVERNSPMDGDGIKRCLPHEEAEKKWRADPADGKRPMMETRQELTSILAFS